MRVEVFYASADEQWSFEVELPMGATVNDAIERSGVIDQVDGLDIKADRIGVFGKRVASDHVLDDGDRVEIYRPLRMSAAQARRLRAERRKEA